MCIRQGLRKLMLCVFCLVFLLHFLQKQMSASTSSSATTAWFQPARGSRSRASCKTTARLHRRHRNFIRPTFRRLQTTRPRGTSDRHAKAHVHSGVRDAFAILVRAIGARPQSHRRTRDAASAQRFAGRDADRCRDSRSVGGVPTFPPIHSGNSDLQPVAARLQPEMFPDNPLALEGINFIYLNSEKALALDVPRAQALMAWLQRGGHLVVAVEQASDINGNPWLRDLMPCKLEGTAVVNDHSDLQDFVQEAANKALVPGENSDQNSQDRKRKPARSQTPMFTPTNISIPTPLPIVTGKLTRRNGHHRLRRKSACDRSHARPRKNYRPDLQPRTRAVSVVDKSRLVLGAHGWSVRHIVPIHGLALKPVVSAPTEFSAQ